MTSPKVICTSDSNDHFNDPTPEHLRKGVEFYPCQIDGGWNRLFVEKRDDGIYYNGRIVFSNSELVHFKQQVITDGQAWNRSDERCDCPQCKDGSDWYLKYPKYLWLYCYVSSSLDEDKSDEPPTMVKPDGIEFFENDEMELIFTLKSQFWIHKGISLI